MLKASPRAASILGLRSEAPARRCESSKSCSSAVMGWRSSDQTKTPMTATTMNDDTKRQFHMTFLPKRRLLVLRGGRAMMSPSAGSMESIMPIVTDVTMLTYSTWMAVRGTVSVLMTKEKKTERPWAKLTGMLYMSTLTRLSHTRRPSSTATTMVAKLSSASTILAASLDTSVPVIPIATPMLAALSAGASLTPSPVMEHTCFMRCSDFTMLILFSGEARAKTLQPSTIESISSSDMASSWGPVKVLTSLSSASGGMMPSILAMAVAVAGWSPVIILTTMPALVATRTPSMASGRGGSRMATRPIMVRKGVLALRMMSASMSLRRSDLLKVERHTASTRRPLAERRAASSCQYFSLMGLVEPMVLLVTWSLHLGMSLSGAPLTWRKVSLPWACTQHMNLCSEAKGTPPTRLFFCWSAFQSMAPSFMPRVSSATSVG
mmetsp:Transcript_17021/g.33431  ORF Transcript_17021/g.33431 Transcript_17021/m.33431 type:complete len:436 (+) Transcript_17021:1264-2571(+)